MTQKDLVSVNEEDFLDQDPQLRGQNYVCLSFLSPEDVLKRKDVYFFEHFLTSFSMDMNEFFTKLGEKYADDLDILTAIKERYRYIFDPDKLQNEFQYFVNNNSSSLESDFHEKNNFQTSIRGIKVRGVFDTLREAEVRAQVLKRLDDKFHVYVAQVGCWCPWSPNPDDISEQEYAETHLNTLMKNYKENQEKKDVFFEERKRDLQFMKTKTKLEDKDPWTKKNETDEVDASTTNEVVKEEEPAVADSSSVSVDVVVKEEDTSVVVDSTSVEVDAAKESTTSEQ